MSERRRHLLVLLIVLGLIAGSVGRSVTHSTKLGLDLQGGVRLVYQGKPTKQTPVTAESLQRALDIMRERVDAFGVSEPELARTGEDQIEVNLPGRRGRRARRRSRSARPRSSSSTTGRRTSSTRTARPTRPRSTAASSPSPASTTRSSARRSARSRCRRTARPRPASRFYAFDKVSKKPFNNGLPDESARGGARGPRATPRRRRAEVIEVQPGRARPARREARRDGAGPRPPSGSSATTPGSRARTSRTPSRTSTSGAATSRSSPSTSATRARRRSSRSRARSPSAAPTTPTRSTRTRSELAPLRDRARQRARLDPVHQLPREPRRHRRLDRRPDLRRLHDHERAGPREGAQDRRAAAEARPDLALAGLRHARQAGAQPGPQGRHRGLHRSSRSSCSSSTACSASSRPSRWASTPSTSTRSSS